MSSIVNWLAAQPENEVVLASNWNRNERKDSNIRFVTLKRKDSKPVLENSLDYWTDAIQLARKSSLSFSHIGKSGFKPDIILVATGNGAALGLRDLFPEAFIVNYLEPLRYSNHRESSTWYNLQIVQSLQSDLVFSFTADLCRNFSNIIRKPIARIPLCVNTSIFLANKTNMRNSIIINFHNFNDKSLPFWLRRLINLISSYPEYKFIILLKSISARRKISGYLSAIQECDYDNINIQYEISDDVSLDVYSHALLYISPSFELQKETLEAMSCEIAVMTHIREEFMCPGINCLDIEQWKLLPEMLDKPDDLIEIGVNGRQSLLNDFDCDEVIGDHVKTILDSFHTGEYIPIEGKAYETTATT